MFGHSASKTSQCQVLFAQVPYYNLTHPALGPSILKSCLKRVGIDSEIRYFGHLFAETIGLQAYYHMLDSKCDQLKADWTFSDAAFGENFRSHREGYLGSFYPWRTEEMVSISKIAASWIRRIALDVLERQPKILVCSSMFQQNVASLALLKEVKRLDPAIVTIMGGPNTEGMLGVALMRRCSDLDYISTGEGEQSFTELCSLLLDNKLMAPQTLPVGVYSQKSLKTFQGLFTEDLPRATVDQMSESPFPDFLDYFDQIEGSSLDIEPGLLLESSRGCWWGEKKQCTFCGLNGTSMAHRYREVDQTFDMVESLTEKYKVNRVFFVDNIIPKEYINDFLPRLNDKELIMFYEVKADLIEPDIRAFRDAGVRFLQPGIESLSTQLLRLMRKGTSALINIECLRLCREYGIRPTWSLLSGFPGEKNEWYDQMTELMPALTHLRPPNGLYPIRYDRFSPYFYDPDKWGLTLRASPAYQYVYPDYMGHFEDVAYYFEDIHKDSNSYRFGQLPPSMEGCQAAVRKWQDAWIGVHNDGVSAPSLIAEFTELSMWFIRDTRFGSVKNTAVDEQMVSLLLYCRHRRSRAALHKFSVSGFVENFAEFDSLLQQALDHRWMLSLDGMALSLVLIEEATQPSIAYWPAGCYRADRTEVYQMF